MLLGCSKVVLLDFKDQYCPLSTSLLTSCNCQMTIIPNSDKKEHLSGVHLMPLIVLNYGTICKGEEQANVGLTSTESSSLFMFTEYAYSAVKPESELSINPRHVCTGRVILVLACECAMPKLNFVQKNHSLSFQLSM